MIYDMFGKFPPLKKNIPIDYDVLTSQGILLYHDGHYDFEPFPPLPLPGPVNPLSVIKFNSTYMELVDNCYDSRGNFMAIFGWPLLLFGLSWFVFLFGGIARGFVIQDIAALLFMFIVCAPFGYLGWRAFRHEYFNLTHNPIRFNRKTGMVYAISYNREVIAAPWKEIVFMIDGYLKPTIIGNILRDNGQIIDKAFALGSLGGCDFGMKNWWEYIRGYMGENKKTSLDDLVKEINYCLPIEKRRESFKWRIKYYNATAGNSWLLCWTLLFPFTFIAQLSRIIAMCTSKVPKWPDWVEEECRIEEGDPYIRDESTNPPVKWFEPIVNFEELERYQRAVQADSLKRRTSKMNFWKHKKAK